MPEIEPEVLDPSSQNGTPSPRPRRSLAAWWPLVIGLLVTLAGYGYWRFIYYPSTPQYALGRFFEAERIRDYNTLYDQVEATGILKAVVPNAERLKSLVERFPTLLPQIQDYRFGQVLIDGDNAIVETTTTTRSPSSQALSTDKFNVQMVRVNGQWKIEGKWVMAEMSRRGGGGILKSLLF